MVVERFTRIVRYLESPKVRLTFYSVLMIVYILAVMLLRERRLLVLYSGDEHYYVSAGLEYVAGVAPIKANFEHPPLAKYIIGFCESVGLGHICSAVAVYFGCVGAGETLLVVGLPVGVALAVFLALLFDPFVVSLAAHHLLDTYMFLFAGLSIYIYAISFRRGFKLWNAVVCGAVAGLGLACKLPFALLVFGMLSHYLLIAFKSKRLKYRLALLAAAFIACLVAYSLSYLADILHGGVHLFLEHHARMIAYMSQAHPPTLVTIGNGVLLYMLRLEAWRDIGTLRVTIYVPNGSASPIIETTSLGPQHIGFIAFRPYMASLLLPISPIAALCLLEPDTIALLFGLIHVTSLAMLLFGPIWWYYSLPLLTGYLAIAYWLSKKSRKLVLVALPLGTLLAWALYAVLRLASITITATIG